ncbi:hypothetical protein NPIL_692481 [Nephila pilipes]|uniref:Uncharacterized protein n=1 Tax=Nephila pilipes TaxID=299642 RepID=A0A8X6T0S8_NEPPI|nr:hypothetical protein NPIL_692481 [Nephila pilipes]
MHSAPSSSEEEREIETNTSTKPETAQTEENNDSDIENNNGFTVVTRKKRVPPIIIDESMNTPELLKELRVIGSCVCRGQPGMGHLEKERYSPSASSAASLAAMYKVHTLFCRSRFHGPYINVGLDTNVVDR